MRRASFQTIALLLASLPLLGAPCSEEKIIDLVIGFPTTILAEASGSINQATSTVDFDLKTEIDLNQALLDAGIDPTSLQKDAVKLVKVEYRVIQPDQVGNRQITGATLNVGRVDQSTNQILGGAGSVLISGWSGNAGVGNVPNPQAWIDITALIDGAGGGLQLLNDYIRDCICDLQGTPLQNPIIRIDYAGTSSPTNQATLFNYEVRLTFQGTFPQTFTVPFP